MRPNGKKLALLALLAGFAPASAFPQNAAGPGPGACPGCGSGPRRAPATARAFDPSRVTTIHGEIAAIERFGRGRHQGVHLTVAMGSETVDVRLGPDFYVDGQALKLAKGDSVEVKGSRLDRGGAAVIIAQEVRRGDEVLVLRDASGIPLWRGAMR